MIDPLVIQRMALALRGLPGRTERSVVLVTSAEAGEGKSTVARLLARALAAQAPGEVLLVGGAAEPGAPTADGADRVLDGAPLTASLSAPSSREEAGHPLRRLPLGPRFKPAQWFAPSGVAHLASECRAQFPLTLVDGPALAACGAWTAQADRVVLVVDASRTAAHAVREALAQAALAPDRVTVVLNRQDGRLPRWFGA